MYNSWNVDLSDSVKALESIRGDVLPLLINGDIYSIESSDNDILIMFDQYAGIDYIRKDGSGLQGIAARIQWGNSWNTFTIREKRHTGAKTELQKRIEQIDNGYFYPYLTLQAYFDNRDSNKLLSIAVIKTIDLYEYIRSSNNSGNIKQRMSDNLFTYIEWRHLKNKIKFYPKDLQL